MATYARITAALLSATGHRPTLLRRGSGQQLGPVTQAIRSMRQADPADAAIQAIREGINAYFAETGVVIDLDAAVRTAGGAS